jgi:putative hydrolase of HD superfamily
VNFERVFEKKKIMEEGSVKIWEYAETILNDSVEKGILKKSTV